MVNSQESIAQLPILDLLTAGLNDLAFHFFAFSDRFVDVTHQIEGLFW